MTVNRSKPDQYQLRFPPGMRDRLKRAADTRGRSMNAEIIDRLETSFKGWPRINLPDELFERVQTARPDQRRELQAELSGMIIHAVERALPAAGALHRNFSDTFYRLVAQAPEEQREELISEFKEMSLKIVQATARPKDGG